MENIIILSLSVLSGYATFDGICDSFSPATNAAAWIGQKTVAGVNSILAMVLTAGMGYILAGITGAAMSKIKEDTKKKEEDVNDEQV